MSGKKGKNLNLLQLQNEMNEIVFNYIDTTQKWEKAYTHLDDLLNVAIEHFQSHIKKELKHKLTSDTYSVLFLNIVARTIYFLTIAYKEMKKNNSELYKDNALSLLLHSVKCLPNTKNEENKQFLNEIKELAEQLGGNVEEVEKIAEKNNQDPTHCFQSFDKFCELYHS